jgi:lipopolysaccharide/colanic/teichoic acid biosynthesis glycosyltransferase
MSPKNVMLDSGTFKVPRTTEQHSGKESATPMAVALKTGTQARSHAPSVVTLPLEPMFVRPFPTWKRAMDIAGALTGLILFAPIMLFVSLIIKLGSPGPVLFTQMRGGMGGKPFKLYKFRTMVPDAEAQKAALRHLNERHGPAFKMKDDPRITRVGRMLRKTSLDELPQFLNVLKGDMSLVGPRPLPVAEDAELDQWHRLRLEVKPGLTCIWQISGRDESCFDKWVRQDIEYIRNRSMLLDVKLIMLTIPAVVRRRGAH